MKKYLALPATVFLFFAFACSNTGKNNASTTDSVAVAAENDDTAEFAVDAASGGMMEVELGRLAQQNAANQRVKDFGAMMVKDHSEANDKLKQLASEKNIQLPAAPLDKQQKEIDKLKDKTGSDFDKDYMDMMVSDHKKDIKMFQDAATGLSDTDLKTFATETLPVLQTHLDSAEAIYKDIKNKMASGEITEGMKKQSNP